MTGAAEVGTKLQQTRQLADRSLEGLAEALEAGNSEQLDRFLKTLGRFHRYSFGNLLLIMSQKPDATRVAGFHTWKSLKRSVKKGEKGIAIIAPMLIKPKDDVPEDDRGPMVRFKIVHVFDLSQTEGEPLPETEKVTGDPGNLLSDLEAFVADRGIEIEDTDDLGGADGVSMGGLIKLRCDLDPAQRFSVLVHEFSHELLHRDKETRPPKLVRETEAEAVAHVVCDVVGLSTNGATADYIRLYQGDHETLAASLDRIQSTACLVINALQDKAARPTASRNIADIAISVAHSRHQVR